MLAVVRGAGAGGWRCLPSLALSRAYDSGGGGRRPGPAREQRLLFPGARPVVHEAAARGAEEVVDGVEQGESVDDFCYI